MDIGSAGVSAEQANGHGHQHGGASLACRCFAGVVELAEVDDVPVREWLEVDGAARQASCSVAYFVLGIGQFCLGASACFPVAVWGWKLMAQLDLQAT